MKVLQHINKLFCTLLFFYAGNKSYSQREIHPLEPMFTYDYALKYFGNVATIEVEPSYWFIENFMAPIGVKTIEKLEDFSYYPFRNREGHHMEKDYEKRIYNFNSQSGFLESSQNLKVSKEGDILDIESISNYDYNIGKTNTEISVNTNYSSGSLSNIKFFFDNDTKCLVQVIQNVIDTDQIYNRDTIQFFYGKNDLNIEIVSCIKRNESKYESLFILTKDNASDLIDFENKSIYFNKDHKENEIYSLKISVYDDLQIRKSLYSSRSMTFSESHIYYNFFDRFESHPNEKKGLLLFDKNKELSQYHLFESRFEPNSLQHTLELFGKRLNERSYRILSKKRDSKWTFEDLEYSKNSRRKYKRKANYKFRKKENTIYYRNTPSLIYRYN